MKKVFIHMVAAHIVSRGEYMHDMGIELLADVLLSVELPKLWLQQHEEDVELAWKFLRRNNFAWTPILLKNMNKIDFFIGR